MTFLTIVFIVLVLALVVFGVFCLFDEQCRIPDGLRYMGILGFLIVGVFTVAGWAVYAAYDIWETYGSSTVSPIGP